MDCAHDLLTEPIFTARNGPDMRALSLPDTLAALSRDEVEDFAALRPHQRHAWHAFLVQLASIALDRAQQHELPTDGDAWRECLLALTEGQPEPWCLHVADLSKPAFMQPPVPEMAVDGWKEIVTPGDLGILVTSKNHDVKVQLIPNPKIEHWAFALISLQTMEGFMGAGNYGISRMNGGSSSRPSVAYGTTVGAAGRFIRELPVVRKHFMALRGGELGYPPTGGHALLWTLPWDGTTQLALSDLDPSFIEICRRVRGRRVSDQLLAFVATPTKGARIACKELKGCTGDPWTPVEASAIKALTVSSSGFDYRLTYRLLFTGDFAKPAAQSICAEDEGSPLQFLAEVMTGGQGKTEGLHVRNVRIPQNLTSWFSTPSAHEQLSKRAKERIELVQTTRRKVLNPALCAVLQGCPEKLNFRDDRTRPWLQRFEQDVDANFFEELFSSVDLHADEALARWSATLFDLAKQQLDSAIDSAPQPSVRRYRVIHRATALFVGAARKHLPHFTIKEQPDDQFSSTGTP